jgi:hypothetical protein
MATVTITDNAWDHNETPVDSILRPELWFRPKSPSTLNGLMTHREVKASLTLSTGAFTVSLEQDVEYTPVMRWLPDASDPAPLTNQSSMYCEWLPFTATIDGPIAVQPGPGAGIRGDVWWVSLSPPPPGFIGIWLKSDPSVTSDDTDPVIGDFGRYT